MTYTDYPWMLGQELRGMGSQSQLYEWNQTHQRNVTSVEGSTVGELTHGHGHLIRLPMMFWGTIKTTKAENKHIANIRQTIGSDQIIHHADWWFAALPQALCLQIKCLVEIGHPNSVPANAWWVFSWHCSWTEADLKPTISADNNILPSEFLQALQLWQWALILSGSLRPPGGSPGYSIQKKAIHQNSCYPHWTASVVLWPQIFPKQTVTQIL